MNAKFSYVLKSSDKAIMMANHKGYSWFQLCNAINLKLNRVFAWFTVWKICIARWALRFITSLVLFLLCFKLEWYNTPVFLKNNFLSTHVTTKPHANWYLQSKENLPAQKTYIFNMDKGQQQFMFVRAKKNVMRIKSPIRNTLALSPVKILSWRLNAKNSDEN